MKRSDMIGILEKNCYTAGLGNFREALDELNIIIEAFDYMGETWERGGEPGGYPTVNWAIHVIRQQKEAERMSKLADGLEKLADKYEPKEE